MVTLKETDKKIKMLPKYLKAVNDEITKAVLAAMEIYSVHGDATRIISLTQNSGLPKSIEKKIRDYIDDSFESLEYVRAGNGNLGNGIHGRSIWFHHKGISREIMAVNYEVKFL